MVERKVRNDASRNACVLAHLDEVFDARSKGEGAVSHDVDRRFGVAFVNLLHDGEALLSGIALFESDGGGRLDGGTVCARVAEGKLDFKNVRTTLHKCVGDGDRSFSVRKTRNKMRH